MTKQLTEIVRCGCGKSCGCGGGEVMTHADNFTRPRFFAGQLLTEEDLGLLDAYVVGKNRLHNRYFYGAGVVCGLEVSCHECDRGKVNLHPGYALDCCGNDIVVPCLEEIDVIAMIRELRLSQRGGHDCGDPCAEGEDGKRDGVTRHYCLYLRYAEQLLEPVAPYATDQSCDGACEPTRVREGYAVELRCEPHEHDKGPNFLKRVLACFGDLGDLTRRVGQVAANQRTTAALVNARRAQAGEAQFAFQQAEAVRLREAHVAAAAISFDADEELTVEKSYETLEKARVLRQYLVLAQDASPEQLEAADLDPGELRAAEATLNQLIEEAPSNRIVANVADYEKREAEAVLRPVSADPGTPQAAQLQRNMMKLGVPFDAKAQSGYTAGLVAMRDWLLTQLDKSPVLTACNLRARVAAIKLDIGTDREEWSTAHAAAANELARAFAQYLIDCICAAMNPPCPACDDEGVLVACLDVLDCEVVDICNKARTTVLTSNAIRYWLAPLGWLHDALEKLCCEFELQLETPEPPPADDDTGVAATFQAQHYQQFVAPADSAIKRISTDAGIDARTGAGLEHALESVRLTAAATGVSLPEAIGVPGLATGVTLPPLLDTGIRTVATAAVTPTIEQVVASRPVDATTVNAVKDEVVEAIRSGDLEIRAAEVSDERIRAAVVPQVIEELKVAETGVASADEVATLKQSLAGLRGASTRVRNDLGARLNAVTAELESTKAAHDATLERLDALERRMQDEGREAQ